MKTETLQTENVPVIVQSPLDHLSLEFQLYEVEIIKEALERMRHEKLSRCPWVKQESGGYNYQPSKEVKRIQFVENSIKRQLSGL
jgi:hypothetical protein